MRHFHGLSGCALAQLIDDFPVGFVEIDRG